MDERWIGIRLKKARGACGLKVEEAAGLCGHAAADLRRWERGKMLPGVGEVERLANLYGWSTEQLFDPRRKDLASAYGVLLSSRDLPVLQLAPALSRAVRILLDHADLERLVVGSDGSEELRDLMSRARAAFPGAAKDWKDGRRRAAWVREQLNLGQAPIWCIADVVRSAGIRIVWARLTEAGPRGASFRDPLFGPGIVVNLDADTSWWTRRLTLAHELCHGLFDGPAHEPYAVHCRQQDREEGERAARAFALHFVAPQDEVERFLRFLGARREPARFAQAHVYRFMQHFGLGYEAALGHLQTCGWLDRDELMRRRAASHMPMPAAGPPDNEGPPRLFLDALPFLSEERAEMAPLALDAYAAGLISDGRLRELWGASAHEDLGEAFSHLARWGLAEAALSVRQRDMERVA